MPSLWPADLASDIDLVRTPLAILQEQAAILGERTGNLLAAKVINRTNTREILLEEAAQFGQFGKLRDASKSWRFANGMNFVFEIVAPTLSYSTNLFSISHPVELYPVRIQADKELTSELNWPETQECATEEQFVESLQAIFAAARTRRIISALLSQARGISTSWTSQPTGNKTATSE